MVKKTLRGLKELFGGRLGWYIEDLKEQGKEKDAKFVQNLITKAQSIEDFDEINWYFANVLDMDTINLDWLKPQPIGDYILEGYKTEYEDLGW